MNKKDQDNLAKLYVESRADDLFYGDSREDWEDERSQQPPQLDPNDLDRAFVLAKDYYQVNDKKYKSAIKSEIEQIIYDVKRKYDSSYETEELIRQIRGIMQHGSSEQDDYNSENEYERRREDWGSMSAGDMYGDY